MFRKVFVEFLVAGPLVGVDHPEDMGDRPRPRWVPPPRLLSPPLSLALPFHVRGRRHFKVGTSREFRVAGPARAVHVTEPPEILCVDV